MCIQHMLSPSPSLCVSQRHFQIGSTTCAVIVFSVLGSLQIAICTFCLVILVVSLVMTKVCLLHVNMFLVFFSMLNKVCVYVSYRFVRA